MLEKAIEKSVCNYAKKLGWQHRKYSTPGNRAAPDRSYMRPVRDLFFIEFKRTGEEPTPLQWKEIKRLRGLGWWVFVVDNIKDGKTIIEIMT